MEPAGFTPKLLSEKTTGRIRSLDGLRAISIAMVLLAHIYPTVSEGVSTNFFFKVISNGKLGVMIFFVISGYLITKLLLAEKEQKGSISVKLFYIRRAFRIFPVFYIYLLVLVILKLTIYPEIFAHYSTILMAALYLWNYSHLIPGAHLNDVSGIWYVGHTWSLAMEEQFYLLWPLLFQKVTEQRLKKTIIVLLIASPLLRLATYFLFENSRGQIDLMLHTGGETILIGCLGAILEKSESFSKSIQKLWLKKWPVLAAFIFLFFINSYLNIVFKGSYWVPIGHPLTSAVILFLLLWCVHVQSPVQRFLNRKWITTIGVLSYSIYIWQQLYLSPMNWLGLDKFPLSFVLIFITAAASYYLVEKPILNIKKRFSRINRPSEPAI